MRDFPFTIIDCEQRSPEWFAARCGRLTGSRADEAIRKIKSGAYSADRRNLIAELAIERVTGAVESTFQTADMARGLAYEPEARAAYEQRLGEPVITVGFLSHNTKLIGCSLDGYVGEMTGIVEFKVPKPATHIKYRRLGVVPPEYLAQVRHNLLVSTAEWCDFVSYCPELASKPSGLFIVRTTREEANLGNYSAEVDLFLEQVEEEVRELERDLAA